MTDKLYIPLDGSSVNIVRKCGAALSNILDTKFGCFSTFDGVDFESESNTAQHKRPSVVPERRSSFTLRSGVKVSVWKADLTSFQAEAVVNAANTALQHRGGLARVLAAAGGPQIQQESLDYIKKNGYLNTGDTVVLDAGFLPYKKIIHAVGPELSENPTSSEKAEAEKLLKKVIINILDEVAKHGLSSVAIPAISSGLFNYPLPECADTIVLTLKNYYEQRVSQGHLPKQIFLVNNDEPTVSQILRSCQQILALTHPRSYSQAIAGNTRGAARNQRLSVQLGRVCLTLKKDKIEEQSTDVIVNTASTDLNLSMGQISSAILQKAGYRIQDEIRYVLQKGRIIVTGSYDLKCKKVYHTFCLNKKEAGSKALQILSESVLECLETAEASSYKSIAFPAIGTGNLGFSEPEAAKIMLDAVTEFAQKGQRTIEVHFVIFPSQHSTFEAFEKQMRSVEQKFYSNFEAAGFEDRDDFHSKGAAEPQIRLCGCSLEATREAEKWLQDLFSSSSRVRICNNFILHFGKKEYQRLSHVMEPRVYLEEFFPQGHACIEIRGGSKEEAAIAALQVEEMLCNIQKDFVLEEERELGQMSMEKISFKREEVDKSRQEFSDRVATFKSQGLRVLRVERVENSALRTLFDLKKKHLRSSKPPRKMFQRIPAQFCDMVSRIGFHAECAPPEDSYCGAGIYFTDTPKKAMELWREKSDRFLYLVEADVLTGDSTRGTPELILPPPVGQDPHMLFDSVNGGRDVSVVFSGHQALPRYIIICEV